MANRVKGITVEIGGDTTKLQEALKAVNTEIKHTKSELRDVNKLLKLDPGNTELISQKHKLLGQTLEETKNKLNSLKEAQKQAEQALAEGKISQEQYDALKREIIETEQALKSLEKQGATTNQTLQNVAIAGEKWQNTGRNIENVGKKIMPVSLAVAGLGAVAVKTAADFDSGMSKVKAVSGATGSDFDALCKKAREMGAKTMFSASEAADAMNYMAMAGWKTKQMIDGIDGVMNLAAASGEDLATTSDIVTDALTAFGLKAEDSSHFADVLAAASSNANTNVSMMGETFKYAAPIAGALGYSVEDMAVAIGLMANSGVKGSQAGTALRSALTRLASPTKEVSNGMAMLGLTVEDIQGLSLDETLMTFRNAFASLDGTQQAQAASLIFGKNAMSGMLAIINASEQDYNNLSDAIYNADGSAEKMANTMQDNLGGQLKILKSALEELAISFGELLMPAVRGLVDFLTKLVNGINALPEPVKGIIATIGVLIAAIGPILVIVGKLVWSIGTIMTQGPLVVGAFAKVAGFVTGTIIPAITAVVSAIGIVPIVIGAVIAVLVLLWNKCEWFRNGVIAVWEAIKEATITVWNAIKDFFSELWNSISTIFTDTWEAIKNTTTTVFNSISEFFKTAWENIKNFVVSSIENIKTSIETVWNAISTFFTTILTTISTFISTTWNNIKTAVVNTVNTLKTTIESIWNAIKNTISTVINAIKTFVINTWNTIKNSVTSVINGIKSTVSNVFNAMFSTISNTMSNIVNTIKTGFNNAVSFIQNLISSAYNWGADLINGIINGIKSAIGGIASAVSNVASTIKSFLHFSVPDVGPLTDYETWMPDFMKGLARGIEKSRNLVQSSMKNVASDMILNPSLATIGASVSQASSVDIEGQIKAALSNIDLKAEQSGDIVIPVYLGGTLLDEVIVSATQRRNLRSGGR